MGRVLLIATMLAFPAVAGEPGQFDNIGSMGSRLPSIEAIEAAGKRAEAADAAFDAQQKSYEKNGGYKLGEGPDSGVVDAIRDKALEPFKGTPPSPLGAVATFGKIMLKPTVLSPGDTMDYHNAEVEKQRAEQQYRLLQQQQLQQSLNAPRNYNVQSGPTIGPARRAPTSVPVTVYHPPSNNAPATPGGRCGWGPGAGCQ